MECSYRRLSEFFVFDASKSLLSQVRRLILDINNGQVIAYYLNNRQWLKPIDIVNQDNHRFYILNKSVLLKSEKLDNLERIQKESKLIAKKVYNQDGGYLGKASDFYLDMDLHRLKSIIVVRHLFKIFPVYKSEFAWKDIVEILGTKIIVRDDSTLLELTTDNKKPAFA